MDRRFFLTGLVPTLFEPRNEERVSSASPEPLTGVDDAWIEHIERDDHYQLLKTLG